MPDLAGARRRDPEDKERLPLDVGVADPPTMIDGVIRPRVSVIDLALPKLALLDQGAGSAGAWRPPLPTRKPS
jgi:hypothetical protein